VSGGRAHSRRKPTGVWGLPELGDYFHKKRICRHMVIQIIAWKRVLKLPSVLVCPWCSRACDLAGSITLLVSTVSGWKGQQIKHFCSKIYFYLMINAKIVGHKHGAPLPVVTALLLDINYTDSVAFTQWHSNRIKEISHRWCHWKNVWKTKS